MGEDRSFTTKENARLIKEVETYQDILIAPEEEASGTASVMTKHCIYWVTEHHDFDILIKTNDDSAVFLSRLVGTDGLLKGVGRNKLIYFGKKHGVAKVHHPPNFELKGPIVNDVPFEFDYRGTYWPEYMEGGMYGFSRPLAEEIVKNDFRVYSSDDAMVGVWMSALRADTLYLANDQILSREGDFLSSNGSCVAASFSTDPLRLASMWCEFSRQGTLSSRSIVALDVREALDCLGSFERASQIPRSKPLGFSEEHHAATLASLSREWPIQDPPNLHETGRWWSHMGGVFRGSPAALVGTSATVDRLPLFLLEGMHTLVYDDFFQVSERYTSWAPTMYMCFDPVLCASGGDGGSPGAGGIVSNVQSANRFARGVFAAFYVLSGGVDGVQYWRFLQQRVNAHWFIAGMGGAKIRGGGGAPGMGLVADVGGVVSSAINFRVSSRASRVAMGIEVLSYLGFSPIYVTAADKELTTQWGEIRVAIQLAASMYGTEVIYLYADDGDKQPGNMVYPSARGRSGATSGNVGGFSDQKEIFAWAKEQHRNFPVDWDLQMFLRHFPVLSRLEIVDSASSVEAMFPKSPHCRDADDLDRFQKAVLCSVRVSLKHFPSFQTWHIPYGPVRGTFVWARRLRPRQGS